MLEQPLLFTSCSSIKLFNSPLFPKYSKLGHTWYPSPQYTAFVSFFGYHTRPLVTKHPSPNPSKEAEDFSRGRKYPQYASANIPSLLASSLINNCGLLLICIKIMNVFTCDEEISILAA